MPGQNKPAGFWGPVPGRPIVFRFKFNSEQFITIFCFDRVSINKRLVLNFLNFQKDVKGDNVTAKDDLVDLIERMGRSKGRDALVSKLSAILYVEPGEVSLEALARRTGYSLSAVSTAMKGLEMSGKIRRVRKPGSRKAYFYMEKDMISLSVKLMERMDEPMKKLRNRLPQIIEGYKKEKATKEEIHIAEDYYRQIVIIEKLLAELVEKLRKHEV